MAELRKRSPSDVRDRPPRGERGAEVALRDAAEIQSQYCS